MCVPAAALRRANAPVPAAGDPRNPLKQPRRSVEDGRAHAPRHGRGGAAGVEQARRAAAGRPAGFPERNKGRRRYCRGATVTVRTAVAPFPASSVHV